MGAPQAKDIELWDIVVPGFLCNIAPTDRKPSLGLYGELTVEQARVKAQDWLAEVRRGGDPGGAKAEALEVPTMEALCKKFMEGYSKKRNKPSTQDGYPAMKRSGASWRLASTPLPSGRWDSAWAWAAWVDTETNASSAGKATSSLVSTSPSPGLAATVAMPK